MSIEDRLFALAQQYSGQRGPAGLADQAGMISQLSSQAPDLHAEIRALAAALSANAGARISAAGNPDLEAQAIAGEVAAAQKLSMASVTPAIAVVRRLGAAATAATPAADAGWAGDSVIAGTGATQPYAPPVAPSAAPMPPVAPPAAPYSPGIVPTPPAGSAKPIWQNKWAIGGAAAVALLLAYQNFGKPNGPGAGPNPLPSGSGFSGPPVMPTPVGTDANPPVIPTPPMTPTPNNNQGGGLPELASPGGQLPILPVKQQGQSFMVGFSMRGVAGMVMAPPGSWDNGAGMIALARNPQSQQPDSIGGGKFERINSNQGPSRLMRVQWQRDGLSAGPMCVAFVGAGGQDVSPAGARLCVLDGGCSQAIACGQLPASGGGQQGGQQGGQPMGPGGGMQPGQ